MYSYSARQKLSPVVGLSSASLLSAGRTAARVFGESSTPSSELMFDFRDGDFGARELVYGVLVVDLEGDGLRLERSMAKGSIFS